MLGKFAFFFLCALRLLSMASKNAVCSKVRYWAETKSKARQSLFPGILLQPPLPPSRLKPPIRCQQLLTIPGLLAVHQFLLTCLLDFENFIPHLGFVSPSVTSPPPHYTLCLF